MSLSVGDLVVLDREHYVTPENYRRIVQNFSESEGILTRIFNQTPSPVGIVLKKWTREALVPRGNRSTISVVTYVDVAWSDGRCICPIEILSAIKRGGE